MSAIAEAIQDRARPARTSANAERLPAWPLTLLFAPYLAWWALGLIDVILFPIALLMAFYLLRARGVRIPRSYGLWLFFIVWAGISFLQVQGANSQLGFVYRYLVYLGATVVFVYVYNARRQLTLRYVCGLLTVVWLSVVACGFLALAVPGGLLVTPMKYVTPGSLLNNDLVNHMVIRRFSQFNADSYFNLAARPAAPFRYTNNWGNMYSILLPMVIAYMAQVRRTPRFWLLAIVLPLSAVPALLTLNRGMIIGIVVGMVYISMRAAFHGKPRLIVLMLLAAVVGYVVYSLLPVQENTDTRLDRSGSSTDTRSSLYGQSIASAEQRPVFGYGVPQKGNDPNAPPVGTQGQVWMILVSHGPIGLAAAVGWFVAATWQSRRRYDPMGLALHTSVLISILEWVFYGALPYALPVMMVSAAAALRPQEEDAHAHA